MSLSSNCLFHYTDSLKTLKKIIKNGYSPSYCREQYIAVPMVSFCDIPLTNAINYMDYGDYALGMNKNWVNRNGLNPVSYMQLSSSLDSIITKGLTNSHDLNKVLNKTKSIEPSSISLQELTTKSQIVLDTIVELHKYHKPYEGRNDKLKKDKYRFYNEREWRYIPPEEKGKVESFMILDEYESYKKGNPEKPHIKHITLSIKAMDIDYIIVRNEEDIFPLIDFLESIDNIGSAKKVKLLTTRILTKEQIRLDF